MNNGYIPWLLPKPLPHLSPQSPAAEEPPIIYLEPGRKSSPICFFVIGLSGTEDAFAPDLHEGLKSCVRFI